MRVNDSPDSFSALQLSSESSWRTTVAAEGRVFAQESPDGQGLK